MARGYRRLHNEKLHNSYVSPDIIWEDEMGRACSTHGINSNAIFWLENLKVKHHSEHLGVDGRIVLEWTVGK
jgi:hypothetical protein